MNMTVYPSFAQPPRSQPYPVQPLPFRALNARDVMTEAFQKEREKLESELNVRVAKIKHLLPDHCFRGDDTDSACFNDLFAKPKNESECFADAEDGEFTGEDAGAGDKDSEVRENKSGKDTDEGTDILYQIL